MHFKQAVQDIHTLSKYFRKGLQALGSNASKIKPADTRACKGSVDIDSCLANKHPNDPRWDYIVGYSHRVYYIEIHPASTSEVNTVIKKLGWLKSWLDENGLPLKSAFPPSHTTYHWIASGKIAILKNSVYARRLAQSGLDIPKACLQLR